MTKELCDGMRLVARVTVHGINTMSETVRHDLAEFLRTEAAAIEEEPQNYTKGRYTARFWTSQP